MELNEANLQMLVTIVRQEADFQRENLASEEAEGIFDPASHQYLTDLSALELELIKGIQEAGK